MHFMPVDPRLPKETDALICNVPIRMLEGLRDYALYHVPTGGFLGAVLANDLREAVCRADDGNRAALRAIMQYVMDVLPADSWGSWPRVDAWQRTRVIDEPQVFEQPGATR